MKQQKERVYISLRSAHGPCHVHAPKEMASLTNNNPGSSSHYHHNYLPLQLPCHKMTTKMMTTKTSMTGCHVVAHDDNEKFFFVVSLYIFLFYFTNGLPLLLDPHHHPTMQHCAMITVFLGVFFIYIPFCFTTTTTTRPTPPLDSATSHNNGSITQQQRQ